MTPATAQLQSCKRLAPWVWLCMMFAMGCQLTNNPMERIPGDQPAPVARELDYVNLPAYRIEPPDILLIDALRVVPKAPYSIEPNDYLYVQAQGTLENQPINGAHLVDPGGLIDLGAGYGKVRVAGLSLDQATEAVEKHLGRILREPIVSMSLAISGGQQQIVGDRIVGPDGRITLGNYGTVYVSGMTVDEATETITKHLEQYLESPVISVDVFAYNSKMYYVISEGAALGDQIQRFPIVGKETVLDAIEAVGGVSRVSNMKIWIARPNPGHECDQILPVNWSEIVKGGQSATNYQLLPGDRVFIEDNRWAEMDGLLTRVLRPFESAFNFFLVGTNGIQNTNRFLADLVRCES